MTSPLVTRIAPTPSGLLHKGNAFNFLLVWWLARRHDGKIWLRIDDADAVRARDEYVEDIFHSLAWLGIDWDEGPQSATQAKRFSQALKTEQYFQELSQCQDVYACSCARKTIKEKFPDNVYRGLCRDKGLEPQRGKFALRLRVPSSEPCASSMGDFVVWRKDDIPAYQLTSVVDDLNMGATLVVRGEDLADSTTAQIFLAKKMGKEAFAKIRFIHHPLLAGPDGKKLSKSQGVSDDKLILKNLRQAGLSPAQLIQDFAHSWGIRDEKISCAKDLLRHPPPFAVY